MWYNVQIGMIDTKTKVGIVLAFLVAIVLLVGYLMGLQQNMAFGSAPSGLPSTIATTSNPIVNSTAAIVFATSTCSSRIITTASSTVMITWSDRTAQTPTASFGHYQAASTTVAYDSGLYGCDLVKIYSFGSQVITVSESR